MVIRTSKTRGPKPAASRRSAAPGSIAFQSPEEMQAWGRRFAKTLKRDDVVALVGELGAGKTTLVQGIAAAWGYRRGANSPTFALANEYATPRGMIFHMDLYRLSSLELPGFPLEDYWGRGLCLVEWADRAEDRWPAGTIVVRLRITGPTRRAVTIQTRKAGPSHV